MPEPHRLFVATPCTGEAVTTEYLHTIVRMKDWSNRHGSEFSFSLFTLSLSDVAKARNHFAASFVGDPDYTHLLFIDADQGFHPRLVSRMLTFDKPFVAALCPFRGMDMGRFHALSRHFDDPALAERLALDFVEAQTIVGWKVGDSPPSYTVENGFIRAKSVGAGVALYRREVFDRLKAAYPELMTQPNQAPYNTLGVAEPVHQCFAPLQAESGNFLSEDLSFCRRWDAIGGQIFVCVDEDITHVGRKAYQSAYIDRMKHNLFQT